MTKKLMEIIQDCPMMDVIKTATLNYNHVICESKYECEYQSVGKVNYCWKHLMLQNYEKGDKLE